MFLRKLKTGAQEHHIFISRRLLLKMLASYLAVALLPLLFSNIQYLRQVDKAFETEKQEISTILRQSRDRYDEEISALEKVYTIVISDSELLKVSSSVNPLISKKNVYDFVKAQHRIYQISKSFDLIDDMIFYNIPEKFAITANTTYLKPELLPKAMESRRKGYEWPSEIIESLSAKERYIRKWVYLPSSAGDGALAVYINTVYMNNYNNVILYVMAPAQLDSLLSSDSKALILVYNEDGERLSGIPAYPVTDDEILAAPEDGTITTKDNERYLVSFVNSAITSHRLCALTPYSAIESGIIPIRNSNLTYFLVILLCTLVICITAAWVSAKPLDDMMRFLFGKGGESVARALNWKKVDEKIHAIFKENEALTENLNTQNDYLRSYLIYDIINNSNSQSERIITRLKRLGVQTDSAYSLIVFEVPMQAEDSDPAALSLLIHRTVKTSFENVFSILDMTAKRYAVLVSGGNSEGIIGGFHAMQSALSDALRVRVRGCITEVESLNTLGKQYWDAVLSLKMAEESGNEIVEVSSETGDKLELRFPQRLEQAIISSVVTCNPQLLEGALSELYDMNNGKSRMPSVSARLLWEQVCANITIGLMRSKEIPDSLQVKTIVSLKNSPEAENRYQFSHNALSALSSTFILARNTDGASLHRSELGKRIVEYIQLHLTEPDLCLQPVADHFNLSSTYISTLVKNETGMNFSNYCEKLRIANACELLREGKQIQTVAEEVGYSSTHTFRRVFKKVVGTLPSQYQ